MVQMFLWNVAIKWTSLCRAVRVLMIFLVPALGARIKRLGGGYCESAATRQFRLAIIRCPQHSREDKSLTHARMRRPS